MSFDPVVYAELRKLSAGGGLPPVGGGMHLGFDDPVVVGHMGADWLLSGFVLPLEEAPLAPVTGGTGVAWETVTSGFGSTIIWSIATDGNGVWVAGGASGTMSRSTDGGVTWQTVDSGFGSTTIRSVATDGNGVWVAGGLDGTMSRSTPRVGFPVHVPNLYMRIA